MSKDVIEAIPLAQRVIAIHEKSLGPNHQDVATSLNNLSTLYLEQGRYADAELLSKRSLVIREKALGPDHPGVAASLGSCGAIPRPTAGETWDIRGTLLDANGSPIDLIGPQRRECGGNHGTDHRHRCRDRRDLHQRLRQRRRTAGLDPGCVTDTSARRRWFLAAPHTFG